MCVILYKPGDKIVDRETLFNCWQTNPDGAGYSVTLPDGTVEAQKGFMSFQDLYEAVKQYTRKGFELVVHFRITSRGRTNRRQTHPFKKMQSVRYAKTRIVEPVFYMNGTITGLKLFKGMNDTETFIKRYGKGFSNDYKTVVELLQETTESKWLIHAPDGQVYYSSDFIESDGLFYSNLNHEFLNYYSSYLTDYNLTPADMVDSKILKRLGRITTKKLAGFIKVNCQNCLCGYCPQCLTDCRTVKQVKEVLKDF